MNHKILCSDLDGTLLSTKSDVSPFTISEIHRIKPSTKIILVSARMPKSMRYIQESLGIVDEPIICYNGALVLDGLEEIHSSIIPMETLESLYHLSNDHDIKLGLYFKDEWYVEENSERVTKEINNTKTTPVYQKNAETLTDWEKRDIGAHKIMLMGTYETIERIQPKLVSSYSNILNIYRSNDTLIELSPKDVSKLSAIELLIENRYSLKDIIAFGDNYNDAEMLRLAGCGVAMGNARKEVKKIADHITMENTEDGVAHFLKQHFKI
ncbi:Cof-type HAD-IIB family hydrolase [Maribacter polysaccharolyticus]|uniref:Cof-type HAD-IIB family hydrolase n=1 Tax=Maribacter polysaccharolyticus TaxID=3020831 RepID=UPI00237F5A08|nr:Cof-type HAD-IIB family hydrolase [Maribacter polysaccharolyticus]MDE3741391.1 Cof-type HAD-IIB family hydrolase [Maribacter polysaccharolyticus]